MRSPLPRLKNVLRPSFATDPVAEVDPEPFEGFQDAVTEARPGLRLDQAGDRLVPLAFEGDTGWFGNDSVTPPHRPPGPAARTRANRPSVVPPPTASAP